jgi:hypothetical protein
MSNRLLGGMSDGVARPLGVMFDGGIVDWVGMVNGC